MTHHYIVSSLDKTVLGVYGQALREVAFERAQQHRKNGTPCEVFTRDGERQTRGSKFIG